MKSEGGISGGLSRVLDFLLPPLCFGCGNEVGEQGGLCPTCWASLHFITDPYCTSCGFPFAHDMPDGLLCAGCHQNPPKFEAARAALAYNRDSRPLVLSFKHGGRTEGLDTMGKWLKAAMDRLPGRPELIIPVPLHGFRLFRRTYNQSALLAAALSRHSGIPTDPFLLKRIKNTRTQGGLSRTQREINVRAAFKVPDKNRGNLKGRTVLLVDDVYTTGATVENCTKALKKAGAAAIYVLTLARVVEPSRKRLKKKKKKPGTSVEKS